MKHQSLTFIILSLCLLWACNVQDERSELAESIISKHVIRFTEPPKRIPNDTAVDAPLLGNGFTGVALSGAPESQVFRIARNDFWRLKSACWASYPLVLGKVELSVPQLKGASYLVEQQLYDAISTARFAKDDISVYYKTFVAATEDMLIVEIGNDGTKTIEGSIRLTLPGDNEISKSTPQKPTDYGVMEQDITPEGIHYLSRAYVDSVDIKTKAAVAMLVEGYSNGDFTLEPGKKLRFICAFSSNFKSDDCTKTVIEKVSKTSSRELAGIEKEHKKWWKTYWEKSFVSIPDELIEKQYYVSLYGMGSCSKDLNFPPPIFGTWITKEQPAWCGDYHLNYNHIAPYYGLYSANRIEQANPYYMPILAFTERGKYYSEKVTGIPEGILMPVGIGPLGIETSRWAPIIDDYYKWWIDSGNMEDEGSFWGQRSNGAYCVTNMATQFYLTYDKEFTEKVYPFVKGVAHFWENYLTYEDGRYAIYNDAIHEGTIGTMNPILSLGMVRMVMQAAIDMSVFLEIDSDKRETWNHIYTHMSEFPLQERNNKTVFRYTERGTEWWGDNTLGIQHIYPAGQIGLDSNPELLQIAKNTIDEMQRWIDFNGSNSFFPAAVRIGYNPDIILQQLEKYCNHTYPNGFQLGNPHGIENLSTVPNTINEMLCMGHKGVIRLFPVWPADKDAMFDNIRTEGAFLVSSELKNGIVTDITIYSEKGRDLTLKNPWGKGKVIVEEKGTKPVVLEGEHIVLKTTPGSTYKFSQER